MFGLFKKKPPEGPDFSGVDTFEKVIALFERGDLEKVLLLPSMFGGEAVRENVVYLPVGLAAIKADTDHNVIAPLAAEGKLTRYQATPEYVGRSHIPTAIQIVASDPGDFRFTIGVWGDGLKS